LTFTEKNNEESHTQIKNQYNEKREDWKEFLRDVNLKITCIYHILRILI